MKKAMALLGVTLVSGLVLSTAQEIKAQETSENITALRSRRGGSRSSSRGSRSGSKSGFGSNKGHHSDGNSGKGYKSDSGSSLLQVTVLASQNRIQIQDTQSLRCQLLS